LPNLSDGIRKPDFFGFGARRHTAGKEKKKTGSGEREIVIKFQLKAIQRAHQLQVAGYKNRQENSPREEKGLRDETGWTKKGLSGKAAEGGPG